MPPNAKGFEIWQQGARIHSIENPVRLEILRLLGEGPKSLAQLVVGTGRAKSTLSAVHLPSLLESGLVVEVPVPSDNRTKLYRLVGDRLGRSDVDAPRLKEAVLDFAKRQGVAGADALRLVDPLALVASGADSAYQASLASRLGGTIGAALPKQREDAIAGLNAILRAQGLGAIRGGADHVALECPERVSGFVSLIVEAALRAATGTTPRVLLELRPVRS